MAYIKIFVNLRGKKGLPFERKAKIIVKDGVSITSYDDPKFTKVVYDKMIADGKKVTFTDQVLVEEYPKLNKEAIVQKLKTEMDNLAHKLRKTMTVSFSKEYIK